MVCITKQDLPPEMNEQSEAQWLAEALEKFPMSYADEAAGELRRLHEVNQKLLAALEELLEYSEPLRGSGVYSRALAAWADYTQ